MAFLTSQTYQEKRNSAILPIVNVQRDIIRPNIKYMISGRTDVALGTGREPAPQTLRKLRGQGVPLGDRRQTRFK